MARMGSGFGRVQWKDVLDEAYRRGETREVAERLAGIVVAEAPMVRPEIEVNLPLMPPGLKTNWFYSPAEPEFYSQGFSNMLGGKKTSQELMDEAREKIRRRQIMEAAGSIGASVALHNRIADEVFKAYPVCSGVMSDVPLLPEEVLGIGPSHTEVPYSPEEVKKQAHKYMRDLEKEVRTLMREIKAEPMNMAMEQAIFNAQMQLDSQRIVEANIARWSAPKRARDVDTWGNPLVGGSWNGRAPRRLP